MANDYPRRIRRLNDLLAKEGGAEGVFRTMVGKGYRRDQIAEFFSKKLGDEIKPNTLNDWVSDFGWNKPSAHPLPVREDGKEVVGAT